MSGFYMKPNTGLKWVNVKFSKVLHTKTGSLFGMQVFAWLYFKIPLLVYLDISEECSQNCTFSTHLLVFFLSTILWFEVEMIWPSRYSLVVCVTIGFGLVTLNFWCSFIKKSGIHSNSVHAISLLLSKNMGQGIQE